MRTWKIVESLKDLLVFSSNKVVKTTTENNYVTGEQDVVLKDFFTRKYMSTSDLRSSSVTFEDGSMIACISGLEQTGYCDTCADQDTFTVFMVSESENVKR